MSGGISAFLTTGNENQVFPVLKGNIVYFFPKAAAQLEDCFENK